MPTKGKSTQAKAKDPATEPSSNPATEPSSNPEATSSDIAGDSDKAPANSEEHASTSKSPGVQPGTQPDASPQTAKNPATKSPHAQSGNKSVQQSGRKQAKPTNSFSVLESVNEDISHSNTESGVFQDPASGKENIDPSSSDGNFLPPEPPVTRRKNQSKRWNNNTPKNQA